MFVVEVLNAGGELTLDVEGEGDVDRITVYRLKKLIIAPDIAPHVGPLIRLGLVHVNGAGEVTELTDKAYVGPNIAPFSAPVKVTVKLNEGACGVGVRGATRERCGVRVGGGCDEGPPRGLCTAPHSRSRTSFAGVAQGMLGVVANAGAGGGADAGGGRVPSIASSPSGACPRTANVQPWRSTVAMRPCSPQASP